MTLSSGWSWVYLKDFLEEEALKLGLDGVGEGKSGQRFHWGVNIEEQNE